MIYLFVVSVLSAAERSLQLAGSLANARQELSHVGERRPQLRIADLRRQRRILELRQRAVGPRRCIDGAVDQPLRANRWTTRCGGLEAGRRHPVAVGELRISALRPSVRTLDRSKQLFLQPVRVALVEQLIRRAEIRERHADVLDGLGEGVEQVLSRLSARVGHTTQVRVHRVVAHREVARIAVVVHPTRKIAGPLETLEIWADEHGLDIVQIPAIGGSDREVARRGALEPGDLVVALGGDGTVLAALRAAAHGNAPVLGVACGSLGALTAVHADGLAAALERVRAGDWTPRRLPAIAIHSAGGHDEWALNDFVVARHGAGQVIVNLFVDDELYIRLSGDGLIVATPL